MKINLKDKKQLWIFIGILVVVLPILWHKLSALYMAHVAEVMQNKPVDVQVMNPQEKEIFPEFKTTGRIAAKDSINVIARVPGWLEARYFEEGDIVKKGQKLFLIEPDEYRLTAQNARATVNENRAVYNNSVINYRRAEQLLKQDLVSREYYDNALTERNKNRAALDGSIAQLHKANLDLSYTNVTAPMQGRIGKAKVSVGNYVNPNEGILVDIYKTNPMQVMFSLKSSDYITIKKYNKDNSEVDPSKSVTNFNNLSVFLMLADKSMYEIPGRVEFVDNKIDEDTGSVNLRAIFPNPNEILVPGDYVNILLRLNKKHKIMTVPQSATLTDVGTGYYVWVEKDGKAVKKDIVVNYNIDNDWVVESGLDYGDKVIVKGIQSIYKPGQKVNPTQYVPEKDADKKDEAAKK